MSSIFSLFKTQSKQLGTQSAQAGFGLIELMVSISIMVVVISIILARHSAFNGAVLLRSQTYEIALTLREVQLSAVSATSIEGEFKTLLGVYFDTSDSQKFRVFNDLDGDGYDSLEEYGQQGSLDSRFEIREIRAIGDSIAGTGIAVVFQRPNFDARFFDSGGEVNASSIEIDIAKTGDSGTGSDVYRTLEITSTGQITVKQPLP